MLYAMDSITYTAARENLASTMDKVCSDHAPVVITRNRDQSVVMLSLEDYEALEETAHPLRSPANARRLHTAARENLASTMDKVCSDHAPIVITRNRDQSVVMLSLEDYEALEDTAYLLRSPANARRLLDAIHSLETGKGVSRDIDLGA